MKSWSLILESVGLFSFPAEGRHVGVLYEQAVCINDWNYWSLLLESVGLFSFPAEGRHEGVLYEQAVCINNWNYSHLKGGGGLTLWGGRLRQDETSVCGGGRERERDDGMFWVQCKYVTVCLKEDGRRRRGESEGGGGAANQMSISRSLPTPSRNRRTLRAAVA